jgi:hypothetical protein
MKMLAGTVSESKELNRKIRKANGHEPTIAALLNEAGKKFNKQTRQRLRPQLDAVKPPASIYAFCTAEALGWAEFGHREEPRYYELMTQFFDGRLSESDIPWPKLCDRRTPDQLKNAARGFIELKPTKTIATGKASAAELGLVKK